MFAVSRRSLLTASLAAVLPAPFIGRGAAAKPTIKLGCLTDLNGPYSDLVGKGTVGSIRRAIEDFHHASPEIPVELLTTSTDSPSRTALTSRIPPSPRLAMNSCRA